MTTPTSFATLVTPAPRLHDDLLFKRQNGNTICGDLNSAYPNVEAPICAGATSICTFSQNLQGCCDSNNSCQFYTTCIGYFDPAACIGTDCLGCTDSAPYCIKYNFWDTGAQSNYDGYSCGIFQDTSTVFGAATSLPAIAAATTAATTAAATTAAATTAAATSSLMSSAAASSSASSASASTLSTLSSSASRTSGLITTSNVSTSSSATATGVMTPESKSVSHTGAIVGGVVGGILGVALLGAASWFLYKKFFPRSATDGVSRVGGIVPEVQQRFTV